MESINKLQLFCFLGLSDDYPIRITKFQALTQTKGLFETLAGDDVYLQIHQIGLVITPQMMNSLLTTQL